MAVRFKPSEEEPRRVRVARTAQVTLRCPHDGCDWTKRVAASAVVASLRGHYGYQHPNRRLPEPREARAAAGL